MCKFSQDELVFLSIGFDWSSDNWYGIYAYIHWRNMRCHAFGQTHGRAEGGEKGNILLGRISNIDTIITKNRNQGHCASVKQIGPSLLLSASGQAGQVLVNFSFPYFPVSYFLKTPPDPSSLSKFFISIFSSFIFFENSS